MRKTASERTRERGFVLITTMVVLLILTIMAVGLYFRSAVNQQTSVSDRDATRAYYLAETALNYIAWAIHSNPDVSGVDNDADLDGSGTGDRTELVSTGPTAVAYFDTSDPATRVGAGYVNFNGPGYTKPVLASMTLPAHVTLDVDASNNITSSCCTGTPAKNGANVWLTAAVLDANNPDNEIDSDALARQYAIYAYAIGYVNGTPLRMLRAKIGKMAANISDLGSMTNGNQ